MLNLLVHDIFNINVFNATEKYKEGNQYLYKFIEIDFL